MTNMTYAQALDIAINTVSDETAKEKLEALRAQLSKRSSAKTPTKTQKENTILVEKVYEALASLEEGTTVTDLISTSPELEGLSCQKVSALLKKLIDTERIVKEKSGKKVIYKVA